MQDSISSNPVRRLAACLAALTVLGAGAPAALAAPPRVDGPARHAMAEAQLQAFLVKFQRAWASRDDADFLAIWNPDGRLVYPFANRVIQGCELPMLNRITKAQAPDLKWRMLNWTARGDVVVVEWESSNRYGERTVTWRGVDKITLAEGRIIEEVVYADTAPFQAMRQGKSFPALITLPDPAS